MRNIRNMRWVGMLAVAFLMLPLSACDEILRVNNPEELDIEDLADPDLLLAQLQGVVSEFQDEYTRNNGAILWSVNYLTDEQVTGLNWEDYFRVNLRKVSYLEGPTSSLWGGLSRTIRLGEDFQTRFAELAADPEINVDGDLDAATDWRVAMAALYTGYSYVLAGESMCFGTFATSVDELGSTTEQYDGMMTRAIAQFQTAISVANAATDDPPNVTNAEMAAAARTGMARAYLTLGDYANVITNAQAVPAGFSYWIEYSDAQSSEYNGLWGEVHGDNFTMGNHPNFLQGTWLDPDPIVDTQTDPRIQHSSTWRYGHNGSTPLYKPYQGLRFADYSGNTQAPPSAACPACTGTDPGDGDSGDILLYQQDTDILLGDYLEAQHHMYEAMAMQDIAGNEAAIQAFVNARRAVGNQASMAFTGAALFAELREQRARDFYQGGLRLGDLRRWAREGVGDFFPSGTHPWTDAGAYDVWTCFPLPLSEYEGNDNLDKPANPLAPPGGW
jgi:hypothetical protein